MSRTVLLIVGVSLSLPAVGLAQARHAIGPAPGLACMSLNVTQAQAMDPTFVVPFRAAPSQSSAVVGRATAVVFVRNPEVARNGFLEAVQFNGHLGWIAASAVRPWVNPGGNGQRCVPSRMSDGSLGIAPG
jgi:hypothetical protein